MINISNDFINFLKKNKKLSECEIKLYIKRYNSDKVIYKNVKSKEQFKTLIKKYDIKIIINLIELLRSIIDSKNLNYETVSSILMKLSDMYDDEIYVYLKRYLNKYNNNNNVFIDEIFIDKIKIIFNNFEMQKINYLDVGCGDCKKTIMIAEKIGIKEGNIYGIDIPSWGNFNEKTRKIKGINFNYIEPEQKFSQLFNVKMSIITCLMVLHHVKNIKHTLIEINRSMKIDGIFIIKEHDILLNHEKMLTDIQHSFYECTIRNNKNHYSTYYSDYKDKYMWEYLITNTGFEHINYHYIINNFTNNITPTRYYYSYFRKIKDV